ncbi:hypothetical protein RCL_jg12922.t1 [Rhizophagus clarus]|uniref:BED-type domain-containing protein n=1 Tax=Rhizophagus clarus TaxID=94130 RepID=A0A8H3R3E7_9GLOM|nr:hypothetical protein RCL_jg12922.t1 [Rhizophagus clarus]
MEKTNLNIEEYYLQESERSNLSSRRISLSQDDNNKPFKKQKIGSSKQSFVWNYFITINNTNYCQVFVPVSTKNPDEKCNHKVENDATTTNMINHLKKIHNIINLTEQEMFIVKDSQPFYILKSNSFKELLLFLHPFFEIPTEEALSNLLNDMFKTG